MTEVIKGAAIGAMTGAVTGAVDAGAKVTGISDETTIEVSGLKSKNLASKIKSSISNKKTKTGK